jgi:hypothetical protein
VLARFVLWSGLILSWLTIVFIPKENVKKYSPAAILGALLVTIVYELAYYFGWWKLKKVIFSWARFIDFTFILGPFFVGTIWVFHFTYKVGFIAYTFVNVLLDASFSFKFLPMLEKLGVIKLKRISHLSIMGLMLLVSFIIYPYQKWADSVKSKEVP